MVSPARAHFLRASAAALGVAEPQATRSDATQYELMLLKLAEDKRRLKDLQSVERKIEVKRQLLPEYTPWIEGVLKGDNGQQDEVFMNVLVWKIDVGDLAGALDMARYALKHKLAMPDQYSRNLPTILAEEFADTAIKTLAAGLAMDVEPLQVVATLTADLDMHDQVRAKLFKAIGYALRDSAERGRGDERVAKLEQARQHLVRALELHDKVGVKKDIERLETCIKNSAPPSDPATPPTEGQG